MDILVKFSDLVDKDREDISSWKAACDAVDEMARIYPQCFSKYSESLAPLKVHADAGDIEGVSQDRLEVFIAKFLKVLDNEVKIESVDYSGEQRFIEAGRQAAWSIDISGGSRNRELSQELWSLRAFNMDMGCMLSKEDYRHLFRGERIEFRPGRPMDAEALGRELAVEFIAGGDRFTTSDISVILSYMSKEDVAAVERVAREGCAEAVKEGVMDQDFLDRQVAVWITSNDISRHLGKVFEQYSPEVMAKEQIRQFRSSNGIVKDMTRMVPQGTGAVIEQGDLSGCVHQRRMSGSDGSGKVMFDRFMKHHGDRLFPDGPEVRYWPDGKVAMRCNNRFEEGYRVSHIENAVYYDRKGMISTAQAVLPEYEKVWEKEARQEKVIKNYSDICKSSEGKRAKESIKL